MRTDITEKDVIIPERKRGSRKGDNGTVLVVGGSEHYVGAAALAGISALRSGSDLVLVASPEKVAWAVNCLYPDLITEKLAGPALDISHKEKILELSKKADCVVMGNGAGLAEGTKELFSALASECNKPKVIDADAIKAVKIDEVSNAVFTPHKREFELLLENSRLREDGLPGALGNNVILLKGETDRIISHDGEFLNHTGNAGMTVGGTGDVLAGLTGGFIAQGLSLSQGAINAAYIAGKCGDELLEKKKGYSYIASDIVLEIEKIANQLKQQNRRK